MKLTTTANIVAVFVGGMIVSHSWQIGRQARIWNECVEAIIDLQGGETFPNPALDQAKAVRWCNGGVNK